MLIETWSGPFTPAAHAAFVADFWQKRPLLVRGFLADDDLDAYCPLTKHTLINLASSEESPDRKSCEARLVRESGGARPWECARGPFDAAELLALPDDGTLPWTLLVSQVDRALPPVESLRESSDLLCARAPLYTQPARA